MGLESGTAALIGGGLSALGNLTGGLMKQGGANSASSGQIMGTAMQNMALNQIGLQYMAGVQPLAADLKSAWNTYGDALKPLVDAGNKSYADTITGMQGTYDKANALYQPYVDAGKTALGDYQKNLNNLSGIVNGITTGQSDALDNMPGYKYATGEAQKAINNAYGAKGMSGAGVKAASQRAANDASTNYTTFLNNYMTAMINPNYQMAGVGANASSALATQQTNQANSKATMQQNATNFAYTGGQAIAQAPLQGSIASDSMLADMYKTNAGIVSGNTAGTMSAINSASSLLAQGSNAAASGYSSALSSLGSGLFASTLWPGDKTGTTPTSSINLNVGNAGTIGDYYSATGKGLDNYTNNTLSSYYRG